MNSFTFTALAGIATALLVGVIYLLITRVVGKAPIEQRFGPASDPSQRKAECELPPPGWACTRAPGHEGPCAAIPIPLDEDGLQTIELQARDLLDGIGASEDHEDFILALHKAGLCYKTAREVHRRVMTHPDQLKTTESNTVEAPRGMTGPDAFLLHLDACVDAWESTGVSRAVAIKRTARELMEAVEEDLNGCLIDPLNTRQCAKGTTGCTVHPQER